MTPTTATILGKYINGTIALFDELPQRKLETGDIIAWPGDSGYYRLYEDGGKGLRQWNITSEVEAALEAKSRGHYMEIVEQITAPVTKEMVTI